MQDAFAPHSTIEAGRNTLSLRLRSDHVVSVGELTPRMTFGNRPGAASCSRQPACLKIIASAVERRPLQRTMLWRTVVSILLMGVAQAFNARQGNRRGQAALRVLGQALDRPVVLDVPVSIEGIEQDEGNPFWSRPTRSLGPHAWLTS
jgi:hypothetical protein